MTKFYWQEATIQEIALHIKATSKNAVKQQVNYYRLTQNQVMIDKIAHAKKLVQLWNLEEQLVSLRKELYE